MAEGSPAKDRSATGHPFSPEELDEYAARFTEYELSDLDLDLDLDPHGEHPSDE